jgi:hypothetical protein
MNIFRDLIADSMNRSRMSGSSDIARIALVLLMVFIEK